MGRAAGPRICVLGAGHGGTAMAAHLSLKGYAVNLLNRSPGRLEPIQLHGGIELTCGPEAAIEEGFAELEVVSTNPAECVPQADVLMVAVPATGHADVAHVVAGHLRDGQVIVLNPGRTGGALEFRRVLQEEGMRAAVKVAEAQTFIYASRCEQPAQVRVFRVKNTIPVAALPAHHTVDVMRAIKPLYRQFVPGDNVLKTGLNNVGVTFHPAILLLNASRIESGEGNFEFYLQGITPAVARILEAIDGERLAVACALGIRGMSAREWLYVAYDVAGRTLHEAVLRQHGYKGILAPRSVRDHRYISEDVPTSLVPMASLGRMLGVPTPAIDAVVELANQVQECDYWQTGRTVEKLGLAGRSVREILHFALVGEWEAPA
ncbi:MAG: NAD/NADP octopine/nopaline dehydrogenase family protein [Armatimonadota bacterium]